jgi:hypothetical protein
VGYAAPKVALGGTPIASGSRPATETFDRAATVARQQWRDDTHPPVQTAPRDEEEALAVGENEVYVPGDDGSEDSLEMPSD